MSSIVELQIPPHSIDAEQSVLGGILLDGSAIDHVCTILTEQDFYADRHRRIFRAMLALADKTRTIDILLVDEQLKRSGDSQQAGGLAYLGEIMQATPSAHNVERYARLVQERSMLRRLLMAANEIGDRAMSYKAQDSVRQIVDDAQSRIMALSESAVRGEFVDMRTALADAIEFVDKQYHREDKNAITGMTYGYVDLDRMTMGMHPGELIVLAGRPSMGKSALALNVLEHSAKHMQRPGLYFSMEMSTRSLMLRMIAAHSRLNTQRLATGRLNDDEWHRITAAFGQLLEIPILFHEAVAPTVMEIRSLARRAKHQHGELSVIVVDYLQLMGSDGDDYNRVAQIGEMSRGLKNLARELDVPVLALSQLSRKVEERSSKRPIMSDLRESGAIEQDADVILFIYRDEVYFPDKGDNRGKAEIIIAKQRNGPIGVCNLHFSADNTRFENYAGDLGGPP